MKGGRPKLWPQLPSFRWRFESAQLIPRQLSLSPMGILAVGIEHALGVAVQRRQHSDVPSREFPIPIRPDIGALSAARLADEKRFKGDFLASMAV